jgi:putative transposase
VARLPRLTLAGYPHHIIQRGNDRQAIFADDIDRERYLAILQAAVASHAIAVHAYVLMPNHAHLLITPTEDAAIGRALQTHGRQYVRWFNDRHGRTGGLFEGRYRSAVVEADRYLLACMRYIELNPVRAGLASDPTQFPWSSHRHHIGMRTDALVSDHSVFWALGNTPFERQAAYRMLFEQGEVRSELAVIRGSTHGGWVIGSSTFAAALRTARRPSARRPGRPPLAKT